MIWVGSGANNDCFTARAEAAKDGSVIGIDFTPAMIEQTKINALMKTQEMGDDSKELFVQFIVRIATEIPDATIAFFSTLKYVNVLNFEKFRAAWNAKYLGGFVVHSKAFDGPKSHFSIG